MTILKRWTIYLTIIAMVVFCLPGRVLAAVYPNDVETQKQWYLNKIDAFNAWTKTKGSQDVVVAVLDTGVDLDHPDLQNNLWVNKDEIPDGRDNDGNIYVDDVSGWDFVDGDSDPRPDTSDPEAVPVAIQHGTLVSGIIGEMGDNSLNGTGINWRVKIMPLRVLDSRGRGDVGTVEEAIRYAIDKKADIINLSFVGPGFDKKLFLALRDAYQAGILVVAAVGNQAYEGVDLDHDPLYPVCYSGTEGEDVVLGVAAVDENDMKPAFSNYGKNCVDLSAPGVDIYGTMVYKPAQGFNKMFGGSWEGTSLAAPMVTGVAALIKAANPKLKAPEIRDILLSTADPLPNSDFKDKMGRGRVNANRALMLATSGGVMIGASTSIGMNYLLASPAGSFSGSTPQVKMVRENGTDVGNFNPYDKSYRLGLKATSGDVNGDGLSEIITGAGPGGGPHVVVARPDGTVLSSFFAYDKRFRGGVNVATGDINNDGKIEIITGAGPGGGPHVRVFRDDGAPVASFFAYDKNLRGGVNVATGDIDGDGRDELITAPGPGTEPRIKIFKADGTILRSFLAFPSNVKNGVNVAVGDLNGDGRNEIVTSLMKGGAPEVRVFNAEGVLQRAFMAYDENYRGGVSLAVGDLDRDDIGEIVIGAGPGQEASVFVFDGYGKLKSKITPFDKSLKSGVNVGVIKL